MKKILIFYIVLPIFYEFVIRSFQKILGLDAFRGIAAMMVFFFHFFTFYHISVFGIFKAGHLGVDVFFVLSGFLVFWSFWRICGENFSSDTLKIYLKKRFFRIVPLALLVLFLFFPIQFALGKANFFDFFVHFFFLQAFFESTYHSVVPVMWSLSIEIFFYVLLPLMFFLSKKNIMSFLLFSCFLAFLALCFRACLFFHFQENDFSSFQKIFLSEQLWGRFDQFFLGFLLAYTVLFPQKISFFLQKKAWIFGILGIFGFVFMGFLFVHYEGGFRDFFVGQVFFHFLFALSVFLILFAFLHLSEKIQKFLTPFWLQYLGTISYGIYLWHFPILSISAKIIPIPFWGFIFSFTTTIILSALSWHFFEKKFL